MWQWWRNTRHSYWLSFSGHPLWNCADAPCAIPYRPHGQCFANPRCQCRAEHCCPTLPPLPAPRPSTTTTTTSCSRYYFFVPPLSPVSLLAVRSDGRHVACSVSVSELLPYGSRGQLAAGARALLQEQLARCVPGLHATWRPAAVRYPPPLGTQEVEVLMVGMGVPARV